MPRIPRIYIENACYHIITRSNHKQIVFRDIFDFGKYWKMLKKVNLSIPRSKDRGLWFACFAFLRSIPSDVEGLRLILSGASFSALKGGA